METRVYESVVHQPTQWNEVIEVNSHQTPIVVPVEQQYGYGYGTHAQGSVFRGMSSGTTYGYGDAIGVSHSGVSMYGDGMPSAVAQTPYMVRTPSDMYSRTPASVFRR